MRMVRGIVVEAVVFICRTEKSQGIVTAQIEQETMRVTCPVFLRPALYNTFISSFCTEKEKTELVT